MRYLKTIKMSSEISFIFTRFEVDFRLHYKEYFEEPNFISLREVWKVQSAQKSAQEYK